MNATPLYEAPIISSPITALQICYEVNVMNNGHLELMKLPFTKRYRNTFAIALVSNYFGRSSIADDGHREKR